MKKLRVYILVILLAIIPCQIVHSATFNENVQYTLERVMTTLKDYFHQVFGYPRAAPVTPLVFEEPSRIDISLLSPFQQFFRNTITITTEATNILATTTEWVKAQAREKRLSAQQIGDQFINSLITSNRNFITQAAKETLDIDLNLLVPSFNAIKEYVIRLQKAIAPLEHVRLKNQIIVFTNYLAYIQRTAIELQQAGIVKISAALAAKALTGYEQTLVTKFNEVYNAYPQLIEKINDFKIAGPGKIMQSAFNRSSELIEQIIVLHQSTGKIGKILVQNDIMTPLDTIKNDLRKLGNAIDFTTKIKPIIVVAPPTTYDALLAILKTFVFDEGFQIKDLVMQDITTLSNLFITLNHKIELLIPAVTALQKNGAALTQQIEDQFINAIKQAPLRTIPRAPMVLLEIVEANIDSMKKELNMIFTNSALSIKNLSDMLGTTAHFLPYVNQCMGATPETPFIHPDITRGIDFIAEDTNTISNTIDAINEGINNYSLRVP